MIAAPQARGGATSAGRLPHPPGWRACRLAGRNSAREPERLRPPNPCPCPVKHLYAARLRKMFVKEAAAELFVEEATIKQDLGRVLCELESQQEALIRAQLLRHTPEAPRMSEAQRNDALELLNDPQLVERILADYQRCGLVGEQDVGCAKLAGSRRSHRTASAGTPQCEVSCRCRWRQPHSGVPALAVTHICMATVLRASLTHPTTIRAAT